MTAGFVQGLWRFPVLGMAGERLQSTQIDPRGVPGDRAHYAAGPEGRLTVQDVPELAEWTATYPFNPDSLLIPGKDAPYPVITHGAKRFRWGDPRLDREFERVLGRRVTVVRDLEAGRGVVVSSVAPTLDPIVAGINVQLALQLPEAGGWA